MIEYRSGSIFDADVEALVCPVNCVGVMGGGLALEFRRRFPENYRIYRAACAAQELEPGVVLTVVNRHGSLDSQVEADWSAQAGPRLIFNFPTKRHWRNPSKLRYIVAGLDYLVGAIEQYDVRSLAIPALGCGLGGLHWEYEVRPLIDGAMQRLPKVRILVYPPQ